ncbi:MAG: hypothetical protein ACRC5A_12640 [Enterobacteriaceae bacterium]
MFMMNTLYLFGFVYVLFFIVKINGVKQIISSPPMFIFLVNYFYFFILYVILAPEDLVFKYTNALNIALVFVLSFLLTASVCKMNIRDNAVKSVLRKCTNIKANCKIVVLFLMFLSCKFFLIWSDIGTINPVEIFHISYIKVEGVQAEPGNYILSYVSQPLFWLLLMLSMNYLMENNNNLLLCIVIIGSMWSESCSGSKSFILLPLFYLFFLKNRNAHNINMLKTLCIMGVGALFVAVSLVWLNEIREGNASNDFMASFVYRIDYIPTLSGYLDLYKMFQTIWPPFEFAMNFLPHDVAHFLGIQKHLISFDVHYTQFASESDVLASRAGVGIAAINETLRPFNLNVPLFAAMLAGFVSAICTKFVANILAFEVRRRGVYIFSSIVPALQTIAFFEPGPTMFFKFIFSSIVTILVAMPVLFYMRVIYHVKD